ncbi:geranylgeranylglyceryl/heptaprenylglyceryl phosphate synthase [Flavobacterium caeni]|uniref:Geranylgeranylglyceryl phosphate synthase n=1 Tax=Flavobacterium caeni TaxID=490189 RepID=A0A1G5IKT7_9FLAO|nr:geranylgeranylglyceryl/heptaprenylglyceryl phosphate synthase [Flavobacterium caeni]SCY76179.1 putative glycerol-1-phosphate prenyltransferase [Flavobacterium caeni]
MTNLYAHIRLAKSQNQKLLAILLDPDKIDWDRLGVLMDRINQSPASHIFVGGSHVESNQIDHLVSALKEKCSLPVVLFPGNPSQISTLADGILFLSLLSGRNPDFLIGHQVQAAPLLKQSTLEVIPTGYLLIESGTATAVEKVSRTTPLDRNNVAHIVATAQAGELLGNRLIYLEAGSGADLPVPVPVIEAVAQGIDIPLIVGGGIRNRKGIDAAYAAGADLVVIGTAFENDLDFFEKNK